MATDWKGDFEVEGDIVLSDGDDAYAERVCMRVGVNEGEWPYDLTFGLPWFTRILGASPTTGAFRSFFAQAIQADPETLTVGEVQVSQPNEDRKSTLTTSCKSIRGAISTVSRTV